MLYYLFLTIKLAIINNLKINYYFKENFDLNYLNFVEFLYKYNYLLFII